MTLREYGSVSRVTSRKGLYEARRRQVKTQGPDNPPKKIEGANRVKKGIERLKRKK